MNRLQKAAVLVNLIQVLKMKGSWCGGTHVQKAAFFLQELLEVPLGFTFTLYKYGPYSFDLNDELAAMRADEFLRLYVRDAQYGPSYDSGDLSAQLNERFPKTLASYRSRIDFVAERLGECGVADLERLATALFVRKRNNSVQTAEDSARRITKLKPHISFQSALAAVQQIDEISKEAAELT